MHDVARGLQRAGSPTLGERYQEWAAASLIESGAGERAVDFLVELGFAHARRGSELTKFTAGRISEVLGGERQWLPDGIEVLVGWPEAPDRAVEILRTAVKECPANAKLRWKAALVELLVILGRHAEALEVVKDDLPSSLADGARAAIELDAAEATEETQGEEQAETMWRRLLRFADEVQNQAPPLRTTRRAITAYLLVYRRDPLT